jgi:hypothetical protein
LFSVSGGSRTGFVLSIGVPERFFMTAVPAPVAAAYAAVTPPVRGVVFMMISAMGVVAMNV